MVRKILVTLTFMALAAVSLDAELKYTTHMTMKKIEGPAQPPNPIFSMMGDAVLKQLLPTGSADVIYTVGEKGSRTEFPQGGMGQAAGAVALSLPTGEMVVINPADKTYWKMNAGAALAMFQQTGVQPKSVQKRTGEFATIAGVRAERVSFEWSMELPIPAEARSQMPPGFPTDLTMTGDMWIATDRFKQYAALAAKTNDMIAAMGFGNILTEGLLLRSVMRSPMFGDYELESVVTSIGEEPAPASAFEIPGGYKQIAAPGGRGVGPRRQ